MNSRRITFALNEVVNTLNASADRLLREHFGLTYRQFLFLVTLQALENPTASYLAECIGVSRAAVSQSLPRFVERKLVEVSAVYGNEKNLALSLTSKGEQLASGAADFLEEEFRILFKGIESIDLNELHATLQQITHQLSKNQESKNAA